MNLKLQVGEEAFASEYQNEPILEQFNDDVLTAEQVCSKFNGYKGGDVPLACTKLTMFIDVHDKLLFYCVCAWQEDFTGFVIDYGTFPEQRRSFFTLASATRTLGRAFSDRGSDGPIHAGLVQLVSAYLDRNFKQGDGLAKIDRMPVDMGYKAPIVAHVKHKVGGAVMWLSKGVGIKADRKPLSSYSRHCGKTHGHFWYVPNVSKTAEFLHVVVDVNYWKMFVYAGLATAAGDHGCISIFGREGQDHKLFAEHVAHSETRAETQGHGRVVHEWSLRPNRPDNHWLDCLVGCAVGASMCGVHTPGEESRRTRQRKRYTQDDLRRTR